MLLDNQIDISKELMDFIKESPTAFHVVKNFFNNVGEGRIYKIKREK